jgi:predicted  nucleic acid-binding Zn-ribbon protein
MVCTLLRLVYRIFNEAMDVEMADEPDNILFAFMRRIEAKIDHVDVKVDRIENDVHDLKVRMSAVESQVGVISTRLDRIDERVGRIERRLELVTV